MRWMRQIGKSGGRGGEEEELGWRRRGGRDGVEKERRKMCTHGAEEEVEVGWSRRGGRSGAEVEVGRGGAGGEEQLGWCRTGGRGGLELEEEEEVGTVLRIRGFQSSVRKTKTTTQLNRDR